MLRWPAVGEVSLRSYLCKRYFEKKVDRNAGCARAQRKREPYGVVDGRSLHCSLARGVCAAALPCLLHARPAGGNLLFGICIKTRVWTLGVRGPGSLVCLRTIPEDGSPVVVIAVTFPALDTHPHNPHNKQALIFSKHVMYLILIACLLWKIDAPPVLLSWNYHRLKKITSYSIFGFLFTLFGIRSYIFFRNSECNCDAIFAVTFENCLNIVLDRRMRNLKKTFPKYKLKKVEDVFKS